MEKGYVENAFIVDLVNTKKASEVIYELSKINRNIKCRAMFYYIS